MNISEPQYPQRNPIRGGTFGKYTAHHGRLSAGDSAPYDCDVSVEVEGETMSAIVTDDNPIEIEWTTQVRS